MKERKTTETRSRAQTQGKDLEAGVLPGKPLGLIPEPPGLFFFLQLDYQDASITAKHQWDHRRLPTLRQDRGQLHGAQSGGIEKAPGAGVC